MLSYVANHSKQRKSTKVIKVQWIASIWCQKHQTTQNYKSDQITRIASIWRQNDQKCWVTSQTIPNTAKLQKWSNYDELDRFDVKTIKNVELRPKPFKTTQTYKVIKLQWIESIWCQKHQTTQNYKSDQITKKCMD